MISGGSLRLSGMLAEEARTVAAAGSGIGRVSLWGLRKQFPSSRDPLPVAPGDERARDWDDSDSDPPEQGCACWSRWSLSEPPPQVESGLNLK